MWWQPTYFIISLIRYISWNVALRNYSISGRTIPGRVKISSVRGYTRVSQEKSYCSVNYKCVSRSFQNIPLRRLIFQLCSAEYICYDDGCHLRRYASNPVRQGLTEWTKVISQLEIVVDKMHMAGHVDNWCKEMCDPNKFRDLDKVQYVYRPLHYRSDMLFLFLG